YPVQLLVTLYVLVSAIGTGDASYRPALCVLPVVFAGAFLQFEFARKTVSEPKPSETMYSNVLGPRGATAANVALAVIAVGALLIVTEPWTLSGGAAVLLWAPVALLIAPIYGAITFLRRDGEYPILPAVLFILLLYIVLIAAASTLSLSVG
ncbi:MAG: hypothetical protein GX542_12435, partial [Rhodococcus sp.]|nr:hypothetical protein [Rhodococcus sp. (in: high G+C Gram-positive bacteria)]